MTRLAPADTVAALTLWQPWAGLMATRDPITAQPYKRVETRSWPAPANLIGQRIVIASAARPEVIAPPIPRDDERAWRRGHVVASGVLELCAPMFVPNGRPIGDTWPPEPPYWHVYGDGAIGLVRTVNDGPCEWGYSNELTVGDWTDRRYGWLIADLAPTWERCPACWGSGFRSPPEAISQTQRVFRWRACPRCSTDAPEGFAWVVGRGHTDPIACKGSQRVWRWPRWEDERRATE